MKHRLRQFSHLGFSRPLPIWVLGFGLWVFLGGSWALGFAQAADPTPQDLNREATQALEAGELDAALESYRAAAQLLPEAPELAYNQGVVHYRKGNYQEAAESFRRSLATRDLPLEARAMFNLGNCAYAEALQKQQNVPEALGALQRAIAHYKDVIDRAPHDLDARVNMETAQLLMKVLLDRQNQQQQQQDQGDDQEKQDSEQQQDPQQQSEQDPDPGDDGQDSQPPPDQGQQEQQQATQQDQAAKANEAEQDQAQQQAQQDADQEEQSAQTDKVQRRPMTRQEAQALLQLIRDKEYQRRQERLRSMRFESEPVEKDW